jgi:alanyl-tRNA synthetase
MQKLGANPGFFSKLTPIVTQTLGESFPELVLKQEEVDLIIAEEETSFSSLLQKGI